MQHVCSSQPDIVSVSLTVGITDAIGRIAYFVLRIGQIGEEACRGGPRGDLGSRAEIQLVANVLEVFAHCSNRQ